CLHTPYVRTLDGVTPWRHTRPRARGCPAGRRVSRGVDMKRFAAFLLAAALPIAGHADEGMWTFDNFPSAKLAKKYGFSPAARRGREGPKCCEAVRAEMAKIEQECSGGDDKVRCDVVRLYHGGIYDLYKYKRFQDVRLVFAPEFAIAFFGGDPDNFNFPRYDLDVSFIRAYENGKPASTGHYFRWSQTGAKDGELTFVSGHPGGTSRDPTIAQLVFERDVALPDSLLYLAEVRGFLTEYTRRGPEQYRTAESDLFSVENSYKALKGRREALVDDALMQAKVKRENALRAKTKGRRDVAAAWDQIARATVRERQIHDRLLYLE